MSDPIADMLIRIKNAQMVKKEFAVVPYSKIKWEIVNLLLRKSFLIGVEKLGKGKNKVIKIQIKYYEDQTPYISQLKRVSKLSNRRYVQAKKIYSLRHGLGVQIISTPKGIMTGEEARKANLGGEILAEVL